MKKLMVSLVGISILSYETLVCSISFSTTLSLLLVLTSSSWCFIFRRGGNPFSRSAVVVFEEFSLFIAAIKLSSATELSTVNEIGESGRGVFRRSCFGVGCSIGRGGVDLILVFLLP